MGQGEQMLEVEKRSERAPGKKLTINDVAEALGVSVSTVSRAISGKGRIGEATRRRVLAFIEENDYHPNGIAKSLAQSRTNNIAIIVPDVKGIVAVPFFICVCAALMRWPRPEAMTCLWFLPAERIRAIWNG